MAQLKQVCTVTNGSQTVTVIGVNVAYRILANNIFMVSPDLVPYTVAQDATFDGTNTVVKLTGAYQGASGPMEQGVFVTDFTYPDNIPLISQGDVGTAAIWTKAMYTLQEMIGSVTSAGLTAFIAQINATMAASADSATHAQASQDAAKASETNAKTSENNAAASKNAAGASQGAAKNSETNAKTSETNAAASASASATSATASANSATAAAASRTNAGTSEGNASNYAAAAAASRSAAATSETNAAGSAAAALASKNAAGTSEANAKTSETNAKTSETNAAASKTAAATSATNAKTSETNATASATSAASDRSTVQGILSTMNALYLGNKASEPTTDNNGAPLKQGAEYFDTTKQLLRVYTSAGWQDYDKDAQTQAVNATASASAAAGSAAGAATSASNAKTSETNAKASETNAKSSETNAKTSETNAAASKSAAAASATDSQNSATNAKTSETNAAASAAHADAVATAIGNPVAKGGDTMTGDLSINGGKLQSTRYGIGGALVLRSAAGSGDAPTPLLAGGQSGTVTFRGYDGASHQDMASIDGWAEGDVSSASAAGNLRFFTTPAGSVTKVERLRITSSGRLLIGTSSDDGANALQLAGNMALVGAGPTITFNTGGPTITSPAAKTLAFNNGSGEIFRLNSAGRFLIWTTADDGANRLQVGGGIRGINASGALVASSGAETQSSVMITRDGAATDEKSWELLHGSTGAFTLRAISDGYTSSKNAIVVARPTGGGVTLTTMNLMSGGGRVIVGGSYTDDGASALQVGGTFTAMSNGNGTVGNFSPFSYAGGLAIEAYNLGNTVKKNVALAPWGGRVMIGTTADDATNLLQVNGSMASGNITNNGSLFVIGGSVNIDKAAGTARSVYFKTAGSVRWEFKASQDAETGSNAGTNLQLARWDDTGVYIDTPFSLARATGVLTLSKRPLFGSAVPWDNQNVTPLDRVTGGTVSGQTDIITTPTATSAQLSVRGAAGALNNEGKFRLFGTFGSGSDLGSRVVASLRAGFNAGTWGKEYLDFYLNSGTNDAQSDANQSLVMRMAYGGRVLIGTSTDDGSNRLQVLGSAKVTGTLTAGAGAQTASLTSDASNSYLYGSGVANVGSNNGDLAFVSNNVVRGRVNASGRFLIGSAVDDGSNVLQVAGGATVSGVFGNTGGINTSGALQVFSGQLELGSTTAAQTPYLDFHSSGSANDYDARITGSAGTAGTVGAGNLSYLAAAHSFTGDINLADHGNNYSYRLVLKAGSFSPAIRANNAGGLELVNSANTAVNVTVADAGTMAVRGGGSFGGALNVAGQINTSTGSMSISGWSNNAAAGVIYFGPNANNKYLYYDGSNFNFSGGALSINGGTAWHTGNLPAPAQTTGTSFSGQVDHTQPLRMLNSSEIQFFGGGNSYLGRLRGDVSGLVGFINQANTQWTMQIKDNGVISFPMARPTWAGLTPWDTGNFDPTTKVSRWVRTDTTGMSFASGSPPSIGAITSSGNTGNVALTISNTGNNSASAVVGFLRDGTYGAFFGLDTDNQWAVGGWSMGNVRYRLWHEGNFNPGSYQPAGNYSAAGARVQWDSGIVEVGPIGNGTIGDSAPYVVVGGRACGNSSTANCIWLHLALLRNQ